jgi:hypothetical protein
MRIAFNHSSNLQPLATLLTASLVANGHEIIQVPVSTIASLPRREREDLELVNQANLDLYLILGGEPSKHTKPTAIIAAAQTGSKLYGRAILTELEKLGYQDLRLVQSQHNAVLRLPRAALEVSLSLPTQRLALSTVATAIVQGIHTVVYSN